MTDNNSNRPQNQQTDNKAQSKKATTPSTNAAPAPTTNSQNAAQKTVDTRAKPVTAPEPQMKKVDISIAGVTYNIFCPIHEEEALRSAVYYINNFALDIKREAPNLGQENLLVLSCLNLYEKIHSQKQIDDSQRHQSKQADVLLSKIIKDAQAIL